VSAFPSPHTEVAESDDLFWFLPDSCQDLVRSKEFNFILLIMDCSEEHTLDTLFSRLQDEEQTQGMQICVIEVSGLGEEAQAAAQAPSQGVFNLSNSPNIRTFKTSCSDTRWIHLKVKQHIQASDATQRWDPEVDAIPSVVVLTCHGSFVPTPNFSSLVQHHGVAGITKCVTEYRQSKKSSTCGH